MSGNDGYPPNQQPSSQNYANGYHPNPVPLSQTYASQPPTPQDYRGYAPPPEQSFLEPYPRRSLQARMTNFYAHLPDELTTSRDRAYMDQHMQDVDEARMRARVDRGYQGQRAMRERRRQQHQQREASDPERQQAWQEGRAVRDQYSAGMETRDLRQQFTQLQQAYPEPGGNNPGYSQPGGYDPGYYPQPGGYNPGYPPSGNNAGYYPPSGTNASYYLQPGNNASHTGQGSFPSASNGSTQWYNPGANPPPGSGPSY